MAKNKTQTQTLSKEDLWKGIYQLLSSHIGQELTVKDFKESLGVDSKRIRKALREIRAFNKSLTWHKKGNVLVYVYSGTSSPEETKAEEPKKEEPKPESNVNPEQVAEDNLIVELVEK